MKQSGSTEKKRNLFGQKDIPAEPAAQESAPSTFLGKAVNVVRIIFRTLWNLRGIFMAIPVLIAAFKLAAYNSEHLPLLVGINLQSTGEFSHMVSRENAVMTPLMITGGCLALTLLSRKNLYPWLISVFSLAIPILLLITNAYPA